ncbi:MAG TPA: ATP-dependent helicase HrpB [Polyangiales bacterium]
MQVLPIDGHLAGIVGQLRERSSLVLVAEPGAGKTTRLPPALLSAGFAKDGEILVLEPRRIAARMAARRVSSELGEEVGGRIGYQVRFEEASSARTRVRFITEGILTRKLVQDPLLRGVAVVVLDEFHERHIHGDVGLALLRRLQRSVRPELRIVVMSATLDAQPLAAFLDAPVVQVAGRPYEVSIEHAERVDDTKLELKVAGAVRRLVREGLEGDVLVFLPGAAEIRRAQQACEALAREASLDLVVLHGDLPAREQDQALQRSQRRKLILSTNVAETSLTIEGVVAVIDSGLARVAGHSPFSGLPTLVTAPISRSSAEQRAGRAGRIGPGRCIRLYTKHDHDSRPEHDKPELARSDLADTLLAIKSSGRELLEDEWLQAPPTNAWQAAHQLLQGLGALDDSGGLSALGKAMARQPLHPRLARLVLEAQARGVGASGCVLASLLGERDVLLTARSRFDDRKHDHGTASSDLLLRLDLLEAVGDDSSPGRLRAHDLDPGAVSAVRRSSERLIRSFGNAYDEHALGDAQRQEALLLATAAGFFDRVAKRRAPKSGEVVFASGGSATLSPTSVVREAEYVVVVDASEQRGERRGVVAHLVSAVEPEWLLELFPQRVVDRTELRFDAKTERVEAVQTLSYDGLLLDRVSRSDVSGPDAERVLFEAAMHKGIEHFMDRDALHALRERLAFAASVDARVQLLSDDVAERALRGACEGKTSFSQLREVALLDYVYAQLPAGARSRMYELTPEHIELPHGRKLQVHYERDKPPWVESRLQDFFGMREGPKIGGKPLVLHLLAPNQRAVQVTSDLAGFWQRGYTEVRRELSRRYPRHAWPDDPLTAVPSPPTPRRR